MYSPSLVSIFTIILFLFLLFSFFLLFFFPLFLSLFPPPPLFSSHKAQAGWLQHDFGHHTVFDVINLNRALHHVIIGLMKGVSSFWWNYRHYQHHAKPNVVSTVEGVFT